MRRWFFRILIGLAALIVLVVVIVQLVLWSSIPKKLVVKQIEQEMGLRISTESLTTGWLGRSTLTNVSLGLPLSKQSFLNVKTLKVKHTTLFGLLLGRSVSIDYIEIDQPNVLVVQDASGQWNLQEVAELLARAGGGKSAQDSQKQGIPKIPNVRLVDGTVQMIDNHQQTTTISPLNVNGYSQGSLVWNYEVTIADSVSLIGKVAPGGNWKHELALNAHHLDALLKGRNLSTFAADIKGEWTGQVTSDGKITGTLLLDHASAKSVPGAGDVNASGALDVESANGAVTLRPAKMELTTENPTLPDIRLAAGTIISDEQGVRAQSMQVAALGGLAVLDANFDPKTMAGDLQARWSGLGLPNNMSHSGSATASLRMPFEGKPVIKVDVVSQGTTASGSWDAKLNVAGQGQSWKSIDWILTAPALNWNGSRPVQLAQLVGHISQRWPSIELTDLTLPARPHLVSRAAANLANFNWSFWLDAGGAPSANGTVVPINFSINAWGDEKLYTLHDLNLQISDTSLWAGGYYDKSKPNPVNLDVYLTQSPQLAPASPVQGHIGGNWNVSGWLFQTPDKTFHPQMTIKGHLKSNDLVLFDRPVGDIDLQMKGAVDNADINIETTELVMFQGWWSLKAQYPTSKHGLQLKVDVRELPVEEVAKVAKLDGIAGTVSSASWRIEIPASGGLNQVTMDSRYEVRDLSAFGFKVDKVEAVATLENEVFKVIPLIAASGDGRVNTTVMYDLNNPRHIQTEINVDKWPYGTPGGALLTLFANAKLDIDLKEKGVSGPFNASLDMLIHNTPLAHADLASDLRGRILEIHKLQGHVLNGTFNGLATVDIDKPLEAHGQIQWMDVDAAALTPLTPALNGVGGKYSGTITLGPARDPRPLEPVRIDINVDADNGHFKSVRIGGNGLFAVHAVAYANIDRAVLDHSDIHIADGLVHIWARGGRGLISQAAQIDFENLQLDQIAHLDQTRVSTMPGLISGRFALVGSGADPSKLLGQGKIEMAKTDLGNFGPIASLYAIMNPGAGSVPNGTGTITMALEQNQLRITRFSYYNRGIDARGIFTVGPNIWNLPNTPVSGQVVGTAQPLKNTRLPLLADFDQVFGALQGSLTTINVLGPDMSQIRYVPAAVSEMGDSLKSILVGDAKSSTGEQ